jgi:superfamily II DNA or RNA helicase
LAQEPAYKILVFDEFLSTLDVFANGLDAKGYNYYRYDNTIPTSVRESNRKAFQDPADPIKIMLCTIQCAGLGLNFTTARTVIILTPRWNPFFDKQAICRANRIGQTGVVVVYTYKCRDSIENHVYRLRAKKEKKYTGLFDPRHLNQDTLKRLRDLGFDDFKQTVSRVQCNRLIKANESQMGRLKGRLDGKAAEKLTEDNPSGLAREAHMHPPFAPAGPFPWSSGMFGLGSNVSGGI